MGVWFRDILLLCICISLECGRSVSVGEYSVSLGDCVIAKDRSKDCTRDRGGKGSSLDPLEGLIPMIKERETACFAVLGLECIL